METEYKVDYTAAIRQYRQYGRGRSMRRFCDDEGFNYRMFCYYAQRGIKEADIQNHKLKEDESKSESATTLSEAQFIPIEVEPQMKEGQVQRAINSIKICFSCGMELSLQGGSTEEMLKVINAL